MKNQYKQVRQKKYQQKIKELTKCVAGEVYESIISKQNIYLLKLFDQKIENIPSQTICNLRLSQKNEQYFGQYKITHNKNRIKYGLGKLIGPNNSIYIGEWINDIKQGNGIFIDEEGNRYQGQFQNNLKHGFGIEKLINGDRYVGQWKQCFKHGHGTHYSALRMETYEGEFQRDKRSGKGKLLFKSGDCFEGSWYNDLKQGDGIFIFFNGDVFKGNWQNNTIVGKCSLNYKSGDYFIGNYILDKRSGFGTYIFASGDKIQGQWEGNDHCNGKLLYSNHECYQGQLYKGERNGWGKYTYKNGDIYEGQWRNDQKSGFGQHFSENSKVFSGIWSHNHQLCGQYQIQSRQKAQFQLKKQSTIKDHSKKSTITQFSNMDHLITPRAPKGKRKYLD